MPHYLIVGKNFSSLRDKLNERGDTYLLLQDILATKKPDKKLKHRVLANFSSKESILEAVQRLPDRFDGVIAIYENYVLPAAWIAESLHLHGMPPAAAEACTDKYQMRSLFRQAPQKISPDFAEISTIEEALAFAREQTYPLILKPANLAKSLLVTKNTSEEELAANFKKMTGQIEAIYQKYAPHRRPKILIEEFMTGSIHSVDAFVDADGNPHVMDQIVDYKTGYDVGYDDNFHYSRLLPSKLSQKDQDRLRHVAELGCRSLGMRSSPAHIEIIMTPSGPQIVEIGARNGGYRERMHGLANGIDILGAALDLATGRQPQIKALREDGCAVLELFPKTPGDFAGISKEAELRALPSLQYLGVKAKPGQYVGKSADGYKMCAAIILHHADYARLSQDLQFVNTEVAVMTTPAQGPAA